MCNLPCGRVHERGPENGWSNQIVLLSSPISQWHTVRTQQVASENGDAKAHIRSTQSQRIPPRNNVPGRTSKGHLLGRKKEKTHGNLIDKPSFRRTLAQPTRSPMGPSSHSAQWYCLTICAPRKGSASTRTRNQPRSGWLASPWLHWFTGSCSTTRPNPEQSVESLRFLLYLFAGV